MKPFITTLFSMLFTLMNQTAQAAQAKPAANTQVYAENYVHEFFDLDYQPKRQFDNIIRKAMVTLPIAIVGLYGLGFFIFLISFAFNSSISIPSISAIIYLYITFKPLLRKLYQRIDARWKRDT
jgi:ABC-type phosphate/phosphonate transport system permease subunit